MTLATLDIAFRAASVALLLMLAVSLLHDYRNVLAARLGAFFVLGSIAHAVSYSLDVTARVPLWQAPLIALSTGTIVVFWLFTRALFDDDTRFARTVNMDREDFGKGTYRYFQAPLPDVVDEHPAWRDQAGRSGRGSRGQRRADQRTAATRRSGGHHWRRRRIRRRLHRWRTER